MKKLLNILCCSSIFILCTISISKAEIFTVTNNNSSGAGSLNQAVLDANTLTGADTIIFAVNVRGTINNSGVLSLTDALTIIGPGPNLLTITSGGSNRVFLINQVYDATFNFHDLTISGGHCASGLGAGIFAYTQYVNIYNCVIKDNIVTYPNSGGGGIYEVEFNPSSGSSFRLVRNLVSGVYFCRLQTENYSKTIKMLYLK